MGMVVGFSESSANGAGGSAGTGSAEGSEFVSMQAGTTGAGAVVAGG